MSFERSTTDKVAPFAAGVGLYYIFVWIFTFFPAFIFPLTLQRFFFGISGTESAFLGVEGEGGAYVFGILVMTIGTFVILDLAACRQYFIILMLYLITAWPFFYILKHCCNAEEWRDGVWITTYPLPLDWWPLW